MKTKIKGKKILKSIGIVAAFTIQLAINIIKKIANRYQKTNLEVKL
jgi:hypothetical protein